MVPEKEIPSVKTRGRKTNHGELKLGTEEVFDEVKLCLITVTAVLILVHCKHHLQTVVLKAMALALLRRVESFESA